MTRRTLGEVLAVLLIAWPAAAQAPTVPLSLEEAIAQGLAASPRMHEAAARIAAASAARDLRQAQRGPQAAVVAGYLRTNHVDPLAVPQAGGGSRVLFPDIPDNWRTRLDVSWPVWTSGRGAALVEAADAEVSAAQAEGDAVAARLALEIALAYWQAVTTRAAVEVHDESLARADAWVRDVGVRVEAGVSAPHERLQAEAQRARQRVRRIQAAAAADIAAQELARLTGVPATTTFMLTTPVDQSQVLSGDRSQMRAERAALVARRSAFTAAAQAAMAVRLPQVATFAGVEHAQPNARFVPRTNQWRTSWDLGVSVSWTLWDHGRARAEQAAASAQAQVLSYRVQDFDERLEVELALHRRDIESGTAAVGAADEAVAAAAEVYRVLRVRAAEGVATSAEVLDAHLLWLEAALERTQVFAALRVAETRLQHADGRLVRREVP